MKSYMYSQEVCHPRKYTETKINEGHCPTEMILGYPQNIVMPKTTIPETNESKFAF